MFSHPLIVKTRILPILLAALLCNSCGQKGVLYLPDHSSTETTGQE